MDASLKKLRGKFDSSTYEQLLDKHVSNIACDIQPRFFLQDNFPVHLAPRIDHWFSKNKSFILLRLQKKIPLISCHFACCMKCEVWTKQARSCLFTELFDWFEPMFTISMSIPRWKFTSWNTNHPEVYCWTQWRVKKDVKFQ